MSDVSSDPGASFFFSPSQGSKDAKERLGRSAALVIHMDVPTTKYDQYQTLFSLTCVAAIGTFCQIMSHILRLIEGCKQKITLKIIRFINAEWFHVGLPH